MACVMLTGEPPFFGTKCEEDSTGALEMGYMARFAYLCVLHCPRAIETC